MIVDTHIDCLVKVARHQLQRVLEEQIFPDTLLSDFRHEYGLETVLVTPVDYLC